jgi:hypothetical protein
MDKKDLSKIGTNEAKRQHNVRRDMEKKDNEKIYGAAKAEIERINNGGINYALYNLALSVGSFADCRTAVDSCRRVYELLYPYIKKMTAENIQLRAFLKKNGDDKHLLIKDIFDTWSDPQEMATELLKKAQDAAKRRAKMNLYDTKGKKIR